MSAAPPVTATAANEPIVFFDGVCGFCNFWVDFLLKCDPESRLRFAPLQGDTARQRLPAADVEQLHSLVLWTPSAVYRKSSAVVRILRILGLPWSVCGGLLWLIPKPLRNFGYDVIARYRYALFGKKETCRIPTLAERERFLP